MGKALVTPVTTTQLFAKKKKIRIFSRVPMYIVPVNLELDHHWSIIFMAVLFPLPLLDLSVNICPLSGKWKICFRP